MNYFAVSAEEQRAERFSSERLAELASALKREGCLVLQGLLSPESLDRVREEAVRDFQQRQTHHSNGLADGHVLQSLAPDGASVLPEVVAHPLVHQLTRELLIGPRGRGTVVNTLYDSCTNCPGSQPQPVHADGGHLWAELEVAHPPVAVVVNVPLEDTTESNGSTELWPGTQRETGFAGSLSRIPVEALERRRAQVPPLRANTRKGDVLLRDTRLWHRGMPNPSPRPRFMLSMVHNVSWYTWNKAATPALDFLSRFNRG